MEDEYKSFDKEKAAKKFREDHPGYGDAKSHSKWTITPEMLKKIIDFYPSNTVSELSNILGIKSSLVSILITLLRKKGVVLKKNYGTTQQKFDEAFEQLNLKENEN